MLPVPELDPEEEENTIAGLGFLNECLCMTHLKHDRCLEIFVMKEYGIKESWKSLFLVKNLEIYRYGFVAPFSVIENGEFALIIDQIESKVVIYNPKNDNMQDIVVADVDRSTIMYVESLISPKGYYWCEKRHQKYFGRRKPDYFWN
ncbi:uncharacterized protein LOC132038334 [Lycium ferocissimum]|uniref:uncharacterized protein LOC132038334 n=1 Tax=Lycium ferocissimum TaxID=112874 RepID=UPI0028152AE8|nr:uncharacterized protein LOC132038334 [Lycium ferocissimum]